MIVSFPAMVLPAARAIIPAVSVPTWVSTGRYRATSGTLEISWLRIALVPNMNFSIKNLPDYYIIFLAGNIIGGVEIVLLP